MEPNICPVQQQSSTPVQISSSLTPTRAARPSDFALASDLAGLTLSPGVHTNVAAVNLASGSVTLNGGGDANAVFIFQVNGALTMAASTHIVLSGGTQAKNVFWQVNGAGAVGANSDFVGTMMTATAIAVGANSVFNGRALAKTGAITTNSNQSYSVPPAIAIDGGTAFSVSDATPTITGTVTVNVPAFNVSVTVGGQTLAATVQTDGTWSATAALLANNTYPVNASATDSVGNYGTASQALTIDTVLPIVTIVGGASLVTNDPTPTLSGSTDVVAGSLVTVTVAGQTLTGLVQVGGGWNVTPGVDFQWPNDRQRASSRRSGQPWHCYPVVDDRWDSAGCHHYRGCNCALE